MFVQKLRRWATTSSIVWSMFINMSNANATTEIDGSVKVLLTQTLRVIAIWGLVRPSDCSEAGLNNTVERRDFLSDALTVSGFVIEQEDSSRSFVNVVIPVGLNPSTNYDVVSGLQHLLRLHNAVHTTVTVCGSAPFLTLESIM